MNPDFKLRRELLMEHFHWSSLQTFMTWFYSRHFRCILLKAFKYPNCSLLVCIILLIGCLSCLNLKGVVLDCGKQSWKNKPDAYICVTCLVLLCVCVCVYERIKRNPAVPLWVFFFSPAVVSLRSLSQWLAKEITSFSLENQRTRELISAWKMSRKHNKDLSCIQ